MPSTFDTMVGKRIKKQRMEINYSQEQLAASTNCSYRCIQKWESGKTMPRAQMLCNLANVILAIGVLFAVLVLAQIGTAQCVFCDDGCKDDGKGNKAEFCCKSRNSGDDDDDACDSSEFDDEFFHNKEPPSLL